MRTRLGSIATWAAVLLAASTGGCGSAMLEVRHYPTFYDPAIKTVAVLPLANQTLRPGAGNFLADRLSEDLQANRTYDVVSPRQLDTRLKAAKLQLPAELTGESVAEVLRKLGGIDAFLMGTVQHFGADRGTWVEVEPDPWLYGPGYGYGYGYGRRGRRGGSWGYTYPAYRQRWYAQAYISADVKMVRVTDGRVVYSPPAPISQRLGTTDEPPPMTDEILAETARVVARRIVATFAIAPIRLKVDKNQVLRPALHLPDGKVDYTTHVKADDPGLYVEVSLPAPADRNTFRLAIGRKDKPPLVEQSFTWRRTDTMREFFFALPKLVEIGGAGDYEVRLYAGDRLQFERKMKIQLSPSAK